MLSLTSESLAINQFNGLETYARIGAAGLQRSDGGKGTPNLDTAPDSNSMTTQVDRPFYLQIFAGPGRLSSQLKRDFVGAGRHDVDVIQVEYLTHPDDDLLTTKCCLWVHPLMNSGKCVGAWFAFLCKSLSTSRRYDGTGAPPLRDPSHVYGLHNLRPNGQAKVRQANIMAKQTCEIATACALNGVPFAIENAYHSVIWRINVFTHLAGLFGGHAHRVDSCQYGEPYQMKTKLLYYGFNLPIGRIGNYCPKERGADDLCNRQW